MTTVDLGRQIELVMKVAEKSEVNIVVATGVYRWVPPPLWGFDADALAELFVREIEDGIEGTGVRAGIIKIAWDEEALPPAMRATRFEPIARAAARASKKTGVPVSCHTLASARFGEPLLDIFAEEGLDAGAVYIGHCNDTEDIEYLLGLASRGAVLGMDRYFPGLRAPLEGAFRRRPGRRRSGLRRAGLPLARPRRLRPLGDAACPRPIDVLLGPDACPALPA